MKKNLLIFFAIVLFNQFGFSQINLVVEAPLNNNTNGANRGPNGTINHTYLRGCYLVLQSELSNIPSGTNITTFGFTLTSSAIASPASGNFTVYLQNTSDLSYSKGTVFGTALTGMLPYFASVMTVPVSAVTTSVMVTLSSPFNYTGGGIYVAYDWFSPGPFSTTNAIYLGETSTLPLPGGGGANFFSNSAAPTTMTLTNSRPSFLFGFTNSNTNDIQVMTIEAPGKICAPLNASHLIKAYVKNLSVGTKTSILVNLNVTGANPFTNTQTIPSLAAGAGVFVTFAAFNPQVLGLNTISVSVSSDQNNLNNSAVYSQSVTCDQWGLNPPAGNFTVNSVGFSTGTGVILSQYQNTVASSMIGVRCAISSHSPSVGQQLCGALFTSAGVLLATTNTITITSGMLGSYQSFTFSAGQALAASTIYYFGVAQINPSTAPGNFPFGTLASYIQPSNLYASTGLAGGVITPIGPNYGFFGLEAVLTALGNLSIVSTPSSVCAGLCANLAAPQGLTNYTWSTGSTATGISACPTSIANSYSVIGTGTLGCPAIGTVIVPVNQLPIVSISSATNALCIGGQISFTANGAVNYSLNNVASPANIVQTPLNSTAYVVSGADANGCVNSASLNVSVFSATFTISQNAAICKGKTFTLSANPSSNFYNWTDGTLNIPFQNATVTPTITTTYTFTGTDANNCSQTSMVTLTVNPNPTVTAIPTRSVICKGESVTISGNGASTYTWNNTTQATSITVSPVTNTNYVVVGATAAGCTNTVTILQLVAPCTGINEAGELNKLVKIYPNPSNGIFNISCENFEQTRSLEIYNMMGALISRQEMQSENTVIDLSAAANGIYFMQVISDEKTAQIFKIIKE